MNYIFFKLVLHVMNYIFLNVVLLVMSYIFFKVLLFVGYNELLLNYVFSTFYFASFSIPVTRTWSMAAAKATGDRRPSAASAPGGMP